MCVQQPFQQAPSAKCLGRVKQTNYTICKTYHTDVAPTKNAVVVRLTAKGIYIMMH
jgi:hypothetical protein